MRMPEWHFQPFVSSFLGSNRSRSHVSSTRRASRRPSDLAGGSWRVGKRSIVELWLTNVMLTLHPCKCFGTHLLVLGVFYLLAARAVRLDEGVRQQPADHSPHLLRLIGGVLQPKHA